MELEQWYKEQIEANTENPPEKVWEEVQNALDIDQVWSKVNSELQPASRKNQSIWIAVAASFLLLISALGTLWYQAGMLREPGTADASMAMESTAVQELPAITGTQTALNIKNLPLLSITHRNIKSLLFENENSTAPLSDPRLANTTKLPVSLPKPVQLAALSLSDKITAPAYAPIHLIMNGDDNFLADHLLVPIADDGETFRLGKYFGLSMQYANTWLRNEKTAAGLQNTSLVDTRPSFGKSFGVVLGQQLSESLDLKLGLDIISEKSQAYNEYVHGQYVSTGIDMDYSKLTLTAAYRFAHNSPHRTVAGVYAAYLNDASQLIDGAGESVTREYSKIDFGLVAGYEYIHQLGRHMQLGTGVYANYGLQNVFAGNEQLPATLNRTHLLSLHFGVTLGYVFR